jgi:hypothetical protein
MAKDEVTSLKETIREAHEATKDMRLAMREARSLLTEMEQVRSRLIATASDVFQEQMAGDVEAGLAEWKATLQTQIEGATNAVMHRFDTLVSLMLDGNERTPPPPAGESALEKLIMEKIGGL